MFWILKKVPRLDKQGFTLNHTKPRRLIYIRVSFDLLLSEGYIKLRLFILLTTSVSMKAEKNSLNIKE
jgi:hypothetical protein